MRGGLLPQDSKQDSNMNKTNAFVPCTLNKVMHNNTLLNIIGNFHLCITGHPPEWREHMTPIMTGMILL